MKSIVTRVTTVRNKQRGNPSLISRRCRLASDGILSIRYCVSFVLRIRCCVNLHHVCSVVVLLRSDSQFAFQHQVRQMHRMHRTQDKIFADVPYIGIFTTLTLVTHHLVLHNFSHFK